MPPKRERDNHIHHTNASALSSMVDGVTSSSASLTTATATATASVATAMTTTRTATAANDANSMLCANTLLTKSVETDADLAAEQKQHIVTANSKLCSLVRKSPWLYNRKHLNYGKKHALDKTWIKIAKECNDSVASCKERWRNIRAAFARSVNIYKTHSGPNRIKPYYLHKELSFLMKPMMENRDRSKSDNDDDDSKDEMHHSDTDIAEENHNADDDVHRNTNTNDAVKIAEQMQLDLEMTKSVLNGDGETEKRDERATTAEANCIFYEVERQSDESTEDNKATLQIVTAARDESMFSHMKATPPASTTLPTLTAENSATANSLEADRKFLEAILPEMAAMNARQKIIFKRRIYETLELIFDNNIDFPVAQHNSTLNTNIRKGTLSLNQSQHQPINDQRSQSNSNRAVTVIIPCVDTAPTVAKSMLQPLRIKDELEDVEID